MVDTELTRLDELKAIERRRRLRHDEALEKTQLTRAAEAEAGEERRVRDRAAIKTAIDRETDEAAQAIEVMAEIHDLDKRLAENAGDTRALIRRSSLAQRLAATATARRKTGFVLPGADERLIKLASAKSREALDYFRGLQCAWSAVRNILDDERSTADDEVKAFVGEQIEAAKKECQLAETQCIEEE